MTPIGPPGERHTQITGEGELPHQKWMNFYMKVLTQSASDHAIALHLRVEIGKDDGLSAQKVAEMQAALRELGLVESTTVS